MPEIFNETNSFDAFMLDNARKDVFQSLGSQGRRFGTFSVTGKAAKCFGYLTGGEKVRPGKLGNQSSAEAGL